MTNTVLNVIKVHFHHCFSQQHETARGHGGLEPRFAQVLSDLRTDTLRRDVSLTLQNGAEFFTCNYCKCQAN